MNFLYTIFDGMVFLGRFLGVIFLILGALLLLGFFVFQLVIFYGALTGGYLAWQIFENAPDFAKEITG